MSDELKTCIYCGVCTHPFSVCEDCPDEPQTGCGDGFDEWARENFGEDDRFFLIPEYRR